MQSFAQHYASVSADTTFPDALKSRLQNLAISCDFSSDNTEIYNTPFTLHELTHAISMCGQTSVGPDDIHYDFFKHLSPSALTYLLTAINELFANNTFPATWQESIIIPILKPQKDKQQAKSYRPISLTSCASKVTERMVNTRLKHFLESNDLLDKHQCGFRRGKSTTDNIIRLITDIRTGFHHKQTTVAAFLDITAAFDRVQKPALIYKLHKLGLRGHLANFIINFLTNRIFQVRCGTTLSTQTPQDQGLPQGSVLSPTLFLVMINDMCSSLKYAKYSLFADDVAIWSTHKDLYRAEERVQGGLNQIASWCEIWGFTLSAEKSAAMAFNKGRLHHPTKLLINAKPIKDVKEFKFLGVHLDIKLTFANHIQHMKNKCAKRTNLLRALAGTDWGGDRKTIIQLYTAIIRPIIEYCSIAYHGALTESLNSQIEAIQNASIRVATGAIASTRITALLADANVPTCQERRMQQLCRYVIHVKSTQNHPVQDRLKTARRARINHQVLLRYPPPYSLLDDTLSKLQFELPEIAQRPKVKPFWLKPPPKIEFLFNEKKSDLLPEEMLAKFNEFKSEQADKTFIYTDGSKQEGKIGFAMTTAHLDYNRRLPDHLSIFTAEAIALLAAVKICIHKKLRNIVICSDSKSVLQALGNTCNPTHYIISQIQDLTSETHNITFLWIPGHANIPGNEKADELAKQALTFPETQTLITKYPADDCKAILQQHIHQTRQRSWDELSPNHFHEIKPQLGFWSSSKQNSRQKEVALTRLRLGRTRLNAPWLDTLQSNICAFCNENTVPSVKHILLECSHFNLHRRHITAYCRQENVTLNLKELLGNDKPELLKLLFQYLKDTKLAGKI